MVFRDVKPCVMGEGLSGRMGMKPYVLSGGVWTGGA